MDGFRLDRACGLPGAPRSGRSRTDSLRGHGIVAGASKSLPVQIVPSFEHQVLAWTTVGMMESHVSYNPRIAEKLPSDVLAFALVHEYAHLRLNHVTALSFDSKSAAEIKQRELEADRFAARFWATNDPRNL